MQNREKHIHQGRVPSVAAFAVAARAGTIQLDVRARGFPRATMLRSGHVQSCCMHRLNLNCQSQPEPARASQSQPEPARASQSQPEPARASQSRPESARVGQSRPESARVGQSRPESHLRHASRRRSAFAPPDDRRHERADHRAGVVARPLQLQLRDEVCERHVVPGVVLRLDIMFPLQAVVLVDTSRVRRCPDAPHRRTSRTAEVPRLSMESESGTRVSVP
jgi:hypothetical protein